MDGFPLNPADAVVFAVMLLAALLAFTRGLVAEMLSVASWVGAALITLYTLPFALPIARQYIRIEMIAYGAAAAVLFVVALVILNLIFGRISRGVQNSSLSALDRTLGFLFGLFKGGVLVSVAYLFFSWLVPPDSQPQWLQTARTRPLLTTGAAMLDEMIPASLRTEAMGQVDMTRERARQAIEAKEALDRLSTPVPVSPAAKAPAAGAAAPAGSTAAPAPAAPPPDAGYKDRDRGDLERLIQNKTH